MKFFISSHVLRTLLAASYILQNVQSIPPDNVCCDRANDEAGCLAYTEHDSFSFDNCVGAIGVDCDGVPYDLDFGPVGTITVNLAAPVHSSGGVSVIKTSVGSILHDLCCIKNTQGAFCTGTNYPIDETINLWGNADNSCACIMEWRKAAWNLLRGRYWEASFNEAAFSSDLNAVPGLIRESWLPTGSGTNYISYKSNWGLEENGATAQLCAPSGTKLDCPSEDDNCRIDCTFCAYAWACGPDATGCKSRHYNRWNDDGRDHAHAGDSDYCCSGEFNKVYWELGANGKTRYGICK